MQENITQQLIQEFTLLKNSKKESERFYPLI